MLFALQKSKIIKNMVKKIIKENLVIIVITLLALFVRFIAVYPGFSENHPDEGIAYVTGIHMLYNSLTPNRFDYPAGVPFLNILVYSILILPTVFIKILLTDPKTFFQFVLSPETLIVNKDLVFGIRGLDALYWSRYISAFMGVLTVILVYITTKKLFNSKTAGIFAAFFLTFSYRYVLGSAISLPDIYNGFFSLLVFLLAIFLLEKNSKSRYIFTGLAIGVTLAMKYQIFTFFPFILSHFIWTVRKKNIFYLFHKYFILGILLAIIVFFAMNPYIPFNYGEFSFQSDLTYRWYQMGVQMFRAYPFFYLYHWGIGELPSIFIILGILLMLISRPIKTLLLLSFVFPFFYIITYYSVGGIYTRNFVTVIPFLMIFAGFLTDFIYKLLMKIYKPASTVSIVIILLIVNYSSIRDSSILAYVFSKPLNSDVFVSWFGKNMPKNVTIRNYSLLLSFKNSHIYTDDLKNKNIKDLPWDYSKGPNSLAEFQENGTDFAILNTQPLQSVTYWWRQFSPMWIFSYDEVPFNYLSNGFYGLAVSELMNYMVYEVYKPWQAPAENNYLVFKIPSKQKNLGKIIKTFNFDNKSEIWKLRGSFNLLPRKFDWLSSEVDRRRGMLVIYGGGQGDTSRLSSPPIEVKPDRIYTIKAWMKNVRKNKEKIFTERDGFIRIDFYKDTKDLDAKGISVAVSSRAFIDKEWMRVSASARVPKEAKLMTVSFQREVQPMVFNTYLDDLEIYESQEVNQEKFKEIPYVKPTIPNSSIYYNTFF